MQTVWKFSIRVGDGPQPVTMPVGAHPLRCRLGMIGNAKRRQDEIDMWFQVESDDDVVKEVRFFEVTGTGHVVPDASGGRYIGIVFDDLLGLVWHVWETTPAAVPA